MTEVVELQPDHIPVAGEILARSFFDDGLARHMYPDDEERRARIPWHFAAMVRYGVMFGRVLTTSGQPRGVAVWLRPGETDMPESRIAAAGMDASPAVLGEEAFGRFMGAMEYIEQFRQQDVPTAHWYLALIGVGPEHAGQGIGGALMKSVLEQADRDRLPCYLETAEEGNVAFYESHGFEVLRHGTVPDAAIDYWTMSRPPR